MATAIPSNRCEFTLAEAADASGGRLSGDDGSARGRGVSIDTRSLEPGAIFVALRGAGSDGHDYLPQAASRGAAAAIVEAGRRAADLPCIEVADTMHALGMLAHHHLARTRGRRLLPVIAIGGAVGKTTTKELTAAAARAIFGETLATAGNLNNLIGVPMTIFTLEDSHRAAVLECGTNTRGEIPKLARIVEPDAAMVLNVDYEHNEGLGTLEDIADEEAALFATAKRYAVASADEPMVLSRIPSRLHPITFGKSPDAHVRLDRRRVAANGRTQIRIEIDSTLRRGPEPFIEFEIGLLGEAVAINFTAAIAGVTAMLAEGPDTRQLQAIASALSAVEPVAGRLATRKIRGLVVIDDTYNSSPRSIRAALAATREVAAGLGARIVIAMGDMLELGPMAAAAHREAIQEIMRAQPAAVVAVGPEMRAAIEALGAASDPSVVVANTSLEAGPMVARIVREGDVLLVKGSRGIAMERIIDALG